MKNTGCVLEENIAQRLHEALNEALSEPSEGERTKIALIIVNTLAGLPISSLAIFSNAMLDFATLSKQSKETALSKLCAKLTESKSTD